MRNITYIFTGCLFVLFGMGLISCNEQDYKLFDSSRTGIYFTEDSVVYSFGVTKLEVTSYEMKLPVKIMGAFFQGGSRGCQDYGRGGSTLHVADRINYRTGFREWRVTGNGIA